MTTTTAQAISMAPEKENKASDPLQSDMDQTDDSKVVIDVQNSQSRMQKFAEIRKKLQGDIIYGLSDRPPLLFAVLLGLQHFLTMFGSSLSFPLVLSDSLCISNPVDTANFIGTTFFVCGFLTLMQTTFGVRLPIVQGASAEFLVPALAFLKVDGECPPPPAQNATMEEFQEATELWQSRLRPIQGAIMIASLMQFLMGASGMIGVILRFVGPVTVASMIGSMGIILFPVAAKRASAHWPIALLTIVLILIFSQVVSNVAVPCPGKKRVQIFSLFAIMFGVAISWFLCFILTAVGAFPNDESQHGYLARTDIHEDVLRDAPWFRIPYPGQFGAPSFMPAAILGMFAGALASILDSVTDYHACASLSGAPPPPAHAVNRGIAVEGVGCFLAGLWGSGTGSSSYVSNISAIGLTKVASRMVIQLCGVILILVGLTGKLNAVFTSIPDPVIGGMLATTFGMLSAVGFSNLQYVDLKSSRNLVIVGMAVFFGVVVPEYASVEGSFDTGFEYLDDLLRITFSTGMLLSGASACILDNIIPGTREQRGFTRSWHVSYKVSDEDVADDEVRWHPDMLDCYDLPVGMKFLRRWKWSRYIPFSPTFRGFRGMIKDKPKESGVNNTSL